MGGSICAVPGGNGCMASGAHTCPSSNVVVGRQAAYDQQTNATAASERAGKRPVAGELLGNDFQRA